MPEEITPQTAETLKDDGAQTIFDDKWQSLMNPFGELCQQRKIDTAIAIAIDREIEDQPLIFVRGNIYEVAKVLTKVLRQLQQKIANDITP